MWFRYIYEQAMYPHWFHYLRVILNVLQLKKRNKISHWILSVLWKTMFLSRCLGLSRVWKDGVTNPKDDYDRYEYERYMNKSGAIWQKFFITRNEDILVTVAFTRHLYNFPRISTLSGTFDGCREVVQMNLFKR